MATRLLPCLCGLVWIVWLLYVHYLGWSSGAAAIRPGCWRCGDGAVWGKAGAHHYTAATQSWCAQVV